MLQEVFIRSCMTVVLMAVIKQTSSELDLWKSLNRGGAPTKIAANDIALYLIDNANNLKAIDSDGSMRSIASGISDVDVDSDYGLVVTETTTGMKSRTGVSSSNAIGTGWNQFGGSATGITTGRYGLVFHWNEQQYAYIATGISSSNREGTSWSLSATGVKQVRCGKLQCFSTTQSNDLYTSGQIPSGYSPTLLDPKLLWAKISDNILDISAYSSNTLWKLDSNGIAWKAVNVIGGHFLKFIWERQTYQPLTFTDIAVTNKIQFTISNDKHVRILTGCPIFDFEDNDLSKWARTGTAFSKQPVVSQQSFYNRPSGKEGDRLIDTFSSRTSYGMSENANASTQTDSPTGTLTSPLFQIRTEILHFVIGGGSPPNNFVGLFIDGVERFQASGSSIDKNNPNGLIRAGRYWWDVSSYIQKCAYIKLVDLGTSVFGHTIFDDLCASPPCFKGMIVALKKIGHDGNVAIGQEIRYKLDMKGFYTSKTRPLSINISFPIANGEPFVYIKKISISHKCATSLEKSQEKKSIQPKSERFFSNLLIYKNYLLSDSVIEVVARVYDHSILQPKAAMSVHGSIKINYADEYLQTIKHDINVTRQGNEIATVNCSEKASNAKYFYIGDNITYNVELHMMPESSQQRAFNVMITLFLPPYLTLLTVHGQESSLGDSLLFPSQSQVAVRIPELLFEDKRDISIIMQIRNDFSWDRLHSKEIPGLFLVDSISYCNKKSCKNAHGNSSDIVYIVKSKEYPFTIIPKNEERERKYTEINVNNGSLIIICGSYEMYGSYSRCYFGNSSTTTWHILPDMVTDVMYYDDTGHKIFGLFYQNKKVELYGEMFKEYKILTDTEWNSVLARKQSLIASQTVQDPDKSVKKNSIGKISYQWECCLSGK